MSDRTWNAVDAKLYDEDWSQGAIIIASCLLIRCPDQYGVFDAPWGFLTRFFQGIYIRAELEMIMVELEDKEIGFLRFYRNRKVIWIESKWKRSGKPTELHWKGAMNHLMRYPEVQEDFLSYYEPYWKGMEGGSKGDNDSQEPPLNPESESDSESNKKETNMPPVGAESEKSAPKKKRKSVPIEDRNMKTDRGRLVQQWYRQYKKYDGTPWSGNEAKMGGQARDLLRDHEYPVLIMAMNFLLEFKPHEQYRQHTWDFYVRKISTLIIEAKQNGYFPDPKLIKERVGHA